MKTQLITKFLFCSIFIFSCLAFLPSTEAATVKQVKGKSVLLQLDGEQLKVGDQLFGVNSESKKTSIIQITKIQKDKALGRILKGKPTVNDTTELRTAGAAASTGSKSAAQPPARFIRQDMIKVGLNFKMTSDTIVSEQEDSFFIKEEVSMSGTNMGVVATLDYPLYPWLTLRGYGGYEMYKVTGTALRLSCATKSSTDCNVDINYLSLGGVLRFNYMLSSFQLWAGLGASIRHPISKKSTALKEENIALANSALVAFGADYHLSNKYFIPASVEYHYSFNTSESVPKIDQLALLIGFGMMF